MATEQELSDYLKSVEKRAFTRSLFRVRDTDAALDIVQNSMLKLAEHYADKPANEYPMLFQRILTNCTLDWFRRNKTHKSHFINFSDFLSATDEDFNGLEQIATSSSMGDSESAESTVSRFQIGHEIEKAIESLPSRQREAFLMRYWEELDVSQTAAAMGCTEGSVKTHCSRAIAKLSILLSAKGIRL